MQRPETSPSKPAEWQEIASGGSKMYRTTVVHEGRQYTVETEQENPALRKAILDELCGNEVILQKAGEELATGEEKHVFVPLGIQGENLAIKVSRHTLTEALKTDRAVKKQLSTAETPIAPPSREKESSYVPQGESLMDEPTLARFDKFRESPDQHVFLFKTKEDVCFLVEKQGEDLIYKDLESPTTASPIRMTPQLKKLLSTHPEAAVNLVNQAMTTKNTLTVATPVVGGQAFFCVKELDNSFSVIERLAPLETAYVIGKGSILLTPAKNPPLMTLSVKVGNSYKKLRDVVVYSRYDTIHNPDFKPEECISIGSGESALFVKRDKIDSLLRHAPEEIKKIASSISCDTEVIPVAPGSKKITSVALPTITSGSQAGSTTFEERQQAMEKFRSSGYKITTVMSPEGELIVVASKKIGKGTYKIVKEVQVLWSNSEKYIAQTGQKFVVAKGKHLDSLGSYATSELLEEVPVARKFREKNVPYVLDMHAIKRTDTAKAGLWMELCEEGPLDTYFSTKIPDPEAQKKFFIMIADGLIGMHRAGIIHSDVKTPNVLVLNTAEGTKIRIADFGLCTEKEAKTEGIAGTFPPPEFMEEYERQEALEKTGIKRAGIAVTEAVDAWAFGVLLFELKTGRTDIAYAMGFNNGSQGIKDARDEALKVLDKDDPVDQVIRVLLHPDPQKRITIEEARDCLTQGKKPQPKKH